LGLFDNAGCIKRLALISDDYPNKRSVLLLAEKILASVNTGLQQPESAMLLADLIGNVYLPFVLKELKAYNDIFKYHLKNKLNDVRLRDFRTVHGQRQLRGITGVNHTSLLRIKSFLSGTFKHAKRQGFLDGVNPIQDVSVPGRPVKFRGPVYSIDELHSLFWALEDIEPSKTIVALAAFTGLRISELQPLRWSDYNPATGTLHVQRSIWRTHIQATKLRRAKASFRSCRRCSGL